MDGIEPYWIWLAAGLVLAGLEMVVPGVYLVWLAVAALVTGAIVFVSAPPVMMQVVCFVFLALIAVFSAKRFLRDTPIVSSDPLLNNRVARMIGQIARVTDAIESGVGRVRVGDGEWLARGPDLAVGQRVRIVGGDGGYLLVEPVTLIADEGTAPPTA
ncbi:NfeD family protein [Qipengyuania spongiae]|uniref:NfeD family protein n=1 Tax=Qipengyuania spongiae TaxID=2909673 RepID=A0ABY5SYS4_9SPHN|nr:NfeD family protein [Qipengyuania spongiae]UVI39687.1 NfeD family protein [Qipengyuania spongiae]